MRTPAFTPQCAAAQITARSISRPVCEVLARAELGPQAGCVSAVFDRAYHLTLSSDEPVALVFPELGDGPLNIVLGAPPHALPRVGAPVQIRLDKGLLEIGGLQVRLDKATIWEPRPDWQRLRAQAANIPGWLPQLATLTVSLAPRDSLASILAPARVRNGIPDQVAPPNAGQEWSDCILSLVSSALELLPLGWAGDRTKLNIAASRLAGLGSGLTPSGDDFLLGVMIWAWLAHPRPQCICNPLLDGSHLRTTSLSAALLRYASRGECGLPWHRLLDSLQGCSPGELVASVRAMLDYGHTSGADALAGFVWMGLHTVVL